jgi:hypothetical protein
LTPLRSASSSQANAHDLAGAGAVKSLGHVLGVVDGAVEIVDGAFVIVDADGKPVELSA